jgi:hypothetical protein
MSERHDAQREANCIMSNRGPCQGHSFRPQDFHAGYQAQVTQDRRITLITGQDMPNPDSESSLLVEALASLGVDSEVVVWREKRDWSAARLIVLRSPWDYADHLTGFLAWVTRVASVSHLRNSADVVRWNVNKRYLLELARHGVPIVPTEVAALGGELDPKSFLHDFATRHRTKEIIVKPTVGIKANGAVRSVPDNPALAQHLSTLLKTGDALVQPFVPAILRTGEVSLIFLGSWERAGVRAVRQRNRDGACRVGRGAGADDLCAGRHGRPSWHAGGDGTGTDRARAISEAFPNGGRDSRSSAGVRATPAKVTRGRFAPFGMVQHHPALS